IAGLSSSWCLHALVVVSMVKLSTQALTHYLNTTEDICRDFADGVKLRKPGSCTEWIECKDFATVEGGACTTAAKPYFNLGQKACYKSVDTTYCSTPCTASTSGYVGNTLNCANWYYCDGKTQMGQGKCTTGQYFDQTKKECVWAKDTVCEAKFDMCDIVPPGVPFRDPANCNMYYTCAKTTFKLTENVCATGLYYSAEQGKCIDKKLVVCDNHPLPEDVCGTKKLAVRNKFVADGATCRGYYYCRDLGSGIPDPDPIYQQCDTDNFFNQERQACMPRESQKCAHDRCDGRQDGYEVAEDAGCKHYYRCENGRETDPMVCPDNQYFDVKAQACTDTEKSYDACA
ncbi:hypothetical protein KR059_008723, partial [Drosophila kikkawai]